MDMRELYQSMIIDHSKHPRYCEKLNTPSCSAQGHNPLCGDEVSVYLKVENNIVTEVGFQGCGCAISIASTSLMLESIKGKNLATIESLFKNFHAFLTEESDETENLGKLAIFSGVKAFPSRVKCATLAWHTLQAALKHETHPVSTEGETNA